MTDTNDELISEYWSEDKTRRAELVLHKSNLLYYVNCWAVFSDKHEEFYDGQGGFALIQTAQEAAKNYVSKI